jgi:hypothetical protein
MKQRRVSPVIVYENADISRFVDPYLLRLTYTDYAEGQADDLEIALADRDRLWQSDWYPVKGDKVEADLECKYWGGLREDIRFRLGVFEVDEISFTGPPSKVRIMAHSAKVTGAMREKKTRAWENMDLATIVSQIASEHGLETMLQVDDPPGYARKDQTEQSDLEFIQRLCKAHNLYAKLAENKIIVSDQEKLEDVVAGAIDAAEVTRYSFRDKTHKIYKACRVTYWDPSEKQEHTHTETDPQAPATGDTLVINERVEDLSKAIERAQKELERANKWELTGSITLPGRPDIAAGVSVNLAGFGAVSGKHFVEQTTHTYNRQQGYTTRLSLRRGKKN